MLKKNSKFYRRSALVLKDEVKVRLEILINSADEVSSSEEYVPLVLSLRSRTFVRQRKGTTSSSLRLF